MVLDEPLNYKQRKKMAKTQEYPMSIEDSSSLLAKHLTKEIFEKLRDKRTVNDYTLAQAINSGVQNPDSGTGVYAGDEQSYEMFAPLFDPIIYEYHGHSKEDKHQSDLNPANLKAPNPDKEGKYILSTRIRVARNIQGLPLGPAIDKAKRENIEQDISNILCRSRGELAGTYYSLSNMSEADRLSLITDHFLFKAGDRFLQAAGLNQDWPSGRGIFHNTDKTFLVWINEEDQLRIISMQNGGDIQEVFTRLASAIDMLSSQVKFAYSDHLGYITSCPTNLGTAMRASVHIRLPNLSDNTQELEAIAKIYHLQIRGIHGEHSSSEDGVYDISNKRRLGITEVQCVQDMHDGVVALIKREQELAR